MTAVGCGCNSVVVVGVCAMAPGLFCGSTVLVLLSPVTVTDCGVGPCEVPGFPPPPLLGVTFGVYV